MALCDNGVWRLPVLLYNNYKASFSEHEGNYNKPLLYTQRLIEILNKMCNSTNYIDPRYLHDMFKVKNINHNIVRCYKWI